MSSTPTLARSQTTLRDRDPEAEEVMINKHPGSCRVTCPTFTSVALVEQVGWDWLLPTQSDYRVEFLGSVAHSDHVTQKSS